MTKTGPQQPGKPVVVTTSHRGVFFGYVPEDADVTAKTIRLERARMCVYWDSAVRGVVGLATAGPNARSKVGPAAPAFVLQDVTAVMDATPEAAQAWEKAPWHR